MAGQPGLTVKPGISAKIPSMVLGPVAATMQSAAAISAEPNVSMAAIPPRNLPVIVIRSAQWVMPKMLWWVKPCAPVLQRALKAHPGSTRAR